MRFIFVAYVVAEIAAFWAMAHFLSVGWALLITVAAAGIGYAVLGARARGLGTDVRRAIRRETAPGGALTDSALFAVAAILTILPGVVSTAVGLLLMTPPLRAVLRPLVAAAAARRASILSTPMTTVTTGRFRGTDFRAGDFRNRGFTDGVVDGDVVDTTVRNPDGSVHVDQPSLPEPRDP
ncbi:FxsA family protein [Gordonia shandongensis]|uniref:FxsA family protein n=1 Tax=Gordonia shandongensis TaxID=376351 RepID=UPI0003FCFEF0|nr:FxsA family protein [Gordonia shandongensis]